MATDVDVLERLRQARARVADHFEKRVEVGDDDVDGLQAVPRQLFEVAGIVAQGQDPTVHGRVERLDPPAQQLWEARDLLHAVDVDARFTQQTFGPTG